MVQQLRNFEAQDASRAPFWVPSAVEQGTVWRALDAARRERGWNQRTLASVASLSESTVASWTTHLPSASSLARAVTALNSHPTAAPLDMQQLRDVRRHEQLNNDRRHPSGRSSVPAPPPVAVAQGWGIASLEQMIGAGGDSRECAKRLERLLTDLAATARSGATVGTAAAAVHRLTSQFCAANPAYVRSLLPLSGRLHEQEGLWRRSYEDFAAAGQLPNGSYDAGHLFHAASQLLTLGALESSVRLFTFIISGVEAASDAACVLPLDVIERRQIALHARLMLSWIDDIRGDAPRATASLRRLLDEPDLGAFGLEAAVRHRLGRAMVASGEVNSSERLLRGGLGHLRRSMRQGRKSTDPYFQLWVYYAHSALRNDPHATQGAAARSHDEIDARKDHLVAHLQCVDALESIRRERLNSGIDDLLAVLETWKQLGYSLGAQRTALRLGHAFSRVASAPQDYRRAEEHFMMAHILSDRLQMTNDSARARACLQRLSQFTGSDTSQLEQAVSGTVEELFARPEALVEP